MNLPWWFLAALSLVVYLVGVHALPTLSFDNPVLTAFVIAAQGFAKPGSAVLLLFSILSLIGSVVMGRKRKKLLARQTDIDSIRALSWEQFEHLVGQAYREQGYQVSEAGGAGPDDGIDLTLRKEGNTTVVQCKH